jgi:regulator of replication initiation timing
VYESRTVIQVGKAGQSEFLEPPSVLIRCLKEEYQVGDKSEGELQTPFVHAVSLDETATESIVTIISRARSAAEARGFLGNVTEKLLRRHDILFADAQKEQQERLTLLENQISETKQQVASLSERIRPVLKSEAAVAAVLELEKGRLLERLPQLERQRVEAKVAMSESQSRPTRLIRQPTLPVKPIRPGRALYLSLAAGLGLMLGGLGAFFAEFIARARQMKDGNQGSNIHSQQGRE